MPLFPKILDVFRNLFDSDECDLDLTPRWLWGVGSEWRHVSPCPILKTLRKTLENMIAILTGYGKDPQVILDLVAFDLSRRSPRFDPLVVVCILAMHRFVDSTVYFYVLLYGPVVYVVITEPVTNEQSTEKVSEVRVVGFAVET